MKVNENIDVNTSKTQFARAYETPGSAGNVKPSSTAARVEDTGDKIDLSSQDLLSQAQASDSSARSSNVDRLRALVQSGQYRVDPAALSQSIVGAAIDGY